MELHAEQLATSIRRRARRMQDVHGALRLFALADEIGTLRFNRAARKAPVRPAPRAKSSRQCFAYWDGEAMVCNAGPSGHCCGKPPRPPQPGSTASRHHRSPAALN